MNEVRAVALGLLRTAEGADRLELAHDASRAWDAHLGIAAKLANHGGVVEADRAEHGVGLEKIGL